MPTEDDPQPDAAPRPPADERGSEPETMEVFPSGGETLFTHEGDGDEDSRLADTMVDRPPSTRVEGRSILDQLATRLDSEAGIRLDHGDDVVLEGPASDKRYETMGEIARGGMGAIVKLVDRDIRRPVAMKVILGEDDQGRLERFIEEAQVTGQLEHPNIVPVHELGLDPKGRVYFTMKLVRGSSLEDMINSIARGEADQTLNDLLLLFLKVCDAVAFAHSRGVIHRDLKPENVMIGSFGEVLVLDWGLAKVKGAPDRTQEEIVATVRSEGDVTRTITGDVMGTPSYMPPEQADGRVEDIDERSDVFSLGGILYRILTHEAPYAAATLTDLLRKAVQGELVAPRSRSPQLAIPAELESVCLKAMARDKEARYTDVRALIDDVRAFLDRRLVSAHHYTPLARLTRLVQRHTALTMGVAVSLFLLVAGGSATWIMASRAEAEAARADAARAQMQAEALQREKAEKEALVARKDATQARSTLDKARAVADVLLTAEVEFEPFLLELKRRRHSRQKLEDRLAYLAEHEKELEAFEKTVKEDSASRAAWQALKGWFLYLGGKEKEGRDLFAASRETDADVPYGALFSAMVHLVDYLDAIEFPRPIFDETMTPKYRKEIRETAEMKEARQRFQEAIKPLRGALIWGKRDASEFTALLDGFRGVEKIRMGRVESGMTKALRVTELRWIREELFLARMTARYLQWSKWDRAYEDAERILFDMPDHARVHMVAGLILITVGGDFQYKKMSPDKIYGKALAHLQKALALDPSLVLLSTYISVAHRQRGIYHYFYERDPLPYYDRSIDLASKGMGSLRDADLAYARLNRALTHQMRAKYLALKGKSPMPDYRAALADLDALIKADPKSFSGRYGRGDLLRRMARSTRTGPDESVRLYQRALEDMQFAVRVVGYHKHLYYYLGRTHLDLAYLLYDMGKNPANVFHDALGVSKEIIEQSPRFPKGAMNKIRALFGLALCSQRSDDGKALSWASQARDEAAAFLDAHPKSWEVHGELGHILALKADLEGVKSEGAEATVRAAIESFGKAVSINRKDVNSQFQRGRLHRLLADFALRRKADPVPHLEASVVDHEAVVKRMPWHALFNDELVSSLLALADALLRQAKDPTPAFQKAVEACQAWATRGRDKAQALVRLGLVRAGWSEARAAALGDDTELAEAAVLDLEKALKASPESVQVLLRLADRYAWLGRFEEAGKVLEKAQPLARGRQRQEAGKKLRQIVRLAGKPAWAVSLWRADDAYARGAWARADRLYRLARAADGSAPGPKALFDHACVMALLSQGRRGQRGRAPIPEAKRDQLRAQALKTLDQAVAAGLDVGSIEKHPWLAPVRKLPAFREHLARWKGK